MLGLGQGVGRRGSWTVVALALANVALGCGETAGSNPSEPPAGQAGSGGDSPSEVTSVDGFFEQEAARLCERIFRCFEPDDDFMSLRFLFETRETCESEVARATAHSGGARDLRAQFAAGSLRLEPAAAQACLDSLSRCGKSSGFAEAECDEVFEGNTQLGDGCWRDAECAGDAYCQVDQACPGQCRPRKAAGEACTRRAECAQQDGALVTCYPNPNAISQCRQVSLAPAVGLGASCTRSTDLDPIVPCTDELWCAPDAPDDPSGVGHCAKPIAGEGACSDRNDVCLIGFCDVASGKCRKYELLSQAGQACGDEQLLFCNPLLGLKCSDDDAGGVCLAQGDGSQGSECFSGDFQRGCSVGLYCSHTDGVPTGTCVEALPAGAPCTSSASCESGQCSVTCRERYCGQ